MLRDAHGFDAAYAGQPPWDIGRPQPAFRRLAESGGVAGRVLDVGCGTGENALLFAARGRDVWGVDASPRAIQQAREKARARGLDATFRVADALELRLGRRFDHILDCGLFHVFSDAERSRFVDSLGRALVAGGSYHVLCFSDREPPGWGPRRIRAEELRATFARGWRVRSIRKDRFETRVPTGFAHAWFATLLRERPGGGR